MKKTKKLLVLFLALVMALSCMAMPAMAAEEEIMPLYEESTCPKHGVMERVNSKTDFDYIWEKHPDEWHQHTLEITTYTYECGYTHTVSRTYCYYR